ncbi:PREDICTED: bile salt-activated lipase [Condylura cristata]|uniref:bile salt-activated lipase n=1 Tax=Condylura cristata TaxID=143302 RepID=UPI00033475B3|nr:PREDICTED: bile salt-activated lipase [Condylura cristata]
MALGGVRTGAQETAHRSAWRTGQHSFLVAPGRGSRKRSAAWSYSPPHLGLQARPLPTPPLSPAHETAPGRPAWDPAGQSHPLGAVYTEGGFVEGVNKKLGLFGDYVDVFKGIPFAAPPKPLEKPQRHPGWQGTLKAKDFKKRCLQTTITQGSSYGEEDCLYLNIWVPQGKKEVSQNLPVMVWIFGGAFLIGSGQGANFLKNYLYDGEELATRGNVIVVTFNYRVGPLGFLSTGDANLPGNYGLWDQHMAIAWVKRNIAAFGGDPNSITIFGESAGGASVSLQVWGLLEGDPCPAAWEEAGEGGAERIAGKVGCPVDDTSKLANCLKITDPRAVTMAYKMPMVGMEYPLVYYLGFLPVVDGDFIPDDPINLFANAADVDYIAGTNDMNSNYLEINKNIDANSMKQHLRAEFLHYWTLTYQALPTVDSQGPVPVPPSEDSEAAPVPPSEDVEGVHMPLVIGF